MKKVLISSVLILFSLKSAANPDFDSCFKDLCGEDSYDVLDRDESEKRNTSLHPDIEKYVGASLKEITENVKPLYLYEENDPDFKTKIYNKCIKHISFYLNRSPSQPQVDQFKSAHHLQAFAQQILSWLGPEVKEAVEKSLIGKTTLKIPLVSEKIWQSMVNNINQFMSNPDKKKYEDMSGDFICLLDNSNVFKHKDYAGMGPFMQSHHGSFIPSDSANIFVEQRFGTPVAAKTDVYVSAYTIQTNDHFVLYHELSHIVNAMDRMGLFPEKASAEVNKIRNCAYQHNMGFQEKIEKSEDIYQIAFESFPDVVGALAVKKAGFKGTPKFFCEMLKAEQKALRHPKLDAGHSGNQHGSALFRSLLVHQQINDKTPKSCSNYLEQIQSKQKFKSCF